MSVLRIDHINVSGSPDLIARCRAFYVDVRRLTDGHRPPFRSRGFWLYAGDAPVAHLTERTGDDAAHAGPFEFTVDHVPLRKQTQLVLHGVPLELNFDV